MVENRLTNSLAIPGVSPLAQAGIGLAGNVLGNVISARGQSQGLQAAEGIMSNSFNINMLFDIMRNQEFSNAANRIAEAQEIKNAVSDRRGDAGELNRLANISGVNVGPQMTAALQRATVQGTAAGLSELPRIMTDADINARGIGLSQNAFNNRLSGELSSAVQQGSSNRLLGGAITGFGNAIGRSALFRSPEQQVAPQNHRIAEAFDIDLGQTMDSQFLPPQL